MPGASSLTVELAPHDLLSGVPLQRPDDVGSQGPLRAATAPRKP